MKALRLASFGVRGFVGSSLTPHVAMNLASAFGTYGECGTILLARDTRYSSPMLHAATLAGLLSAGCDVLDYGVCPTPIIQHDVPVRGARGALSISGGHNDFGWNSLSLIGDCGAFLEPVGGDLVLELYHAGDFERQDWEHLGSVKEAAGFFPPYLDAIESYVDAAAIRAAGYTILADPVGGAGCEYLKPFADRFGLNLVAINGEPTGYLAREPEPRPRSALQMASIIGHTGGHAGFVFSSDMQRMSMVTETGEPTSEEYTFAVIADHRLAKRPGVLVMNCCTSRIIDDVAERHACPVVKTRVGQAHIGATISDEQAVLGGEGSGSVMAPDFSHAFDGFLMMALVLEAMALRGVALSALIHDLPRYHIVKRSLPCESSRAYQAMLVVEGWSRGQTEGRVNLIDGVRVDWDDGWVHVRPSRTERIMRVISESHDRNKARERADELLRFIEKEI